MKLNSANYRRILGVRALMRFRDFFGNLNDPIANRITGIDDQTDNLIFDEKEIINECSMSREDMDYFNNEIIDIAERIEDRLRNDV